MTVLVKDLIDAMDRAISSLALYDMEVRGLDLPGIPDKIWEDLTIVVGALEDFNNDNENKYDELDFSDESDLHYGTWDDEEDSYGEEGLDASGSH